MRKYLFHCFLLCCFYFTSGNAYSQREADYWYFGDGAGLHFDSCGPTPVNNSKMFNGNACATVSNSFTGQLLFYTDAQRVWNATHTIMPNGNDLNGSQNITQGTLIVPVPGSLSKYYLFSLQSPSQELFFDSVIRNKLYYSLVDMELDSRWGDVSQSAKNILLDSALTDKLTAIPHSNGRDYWLLTHQWNSNRFYVYSITDQGIIKANTIAIGSVHALEYQSSTGNDPIESGGYLRASPNGEWIASAVESHRSLRSFDLFKFDAATGWLTNYLNLGGAQDQYGVSFSPDNSKLYLQNGTALTSGRGTEVIRQYDLSTGDSATIVRSALSIIYPNPLTNIPQNNTKNTFGVLRTALALGADGKIYASAAAATGLGDQTTDHPFTFLRINKPNQKGYGCDVQLINIDLGTGEVGQTSGLPNFIQHPFNNLDLTECPASDGPPCRNPALVLLPNPTKDHFQVQYDPGCFIPYTLRMYNVMGQLLAELEVSNALSEKIEIGKYANGVYLIDIRSSQTHIIKKLIKDF